MNGPGWYIYGKGEAGWMGALDGPFLTNDLAIEKAKEWKMPSWEKDELEVEYSDSGEET